MKTGKGETPLLSRILEAGNSSLLFCLFQFPFDTFFHFLYIGVTPRSTDLGLTWEGSQGWGRKSKQFERDFMNGAIKACHCEEIA